MKTLHALLCLFSTALLAGCPTDAGGVGGDTSNASSGSVATDAGPGMPTTEMPTTTAGGGSTGPSTLDSTSGDTPPECATDEECDNGVFCDGAEGCVEGACVSSPAPDCDDGVACTVDSCDDTRGECVNDPDNARCGCEESCHPEQGCGNYCVPTECQGQVYECGNCLDDDRDCQVDTNDTDCWGPCDNNEAGWAGEVPGQQNQSECNTMDCYFDANSGAGNDECHWSHSCDPLEPSGCVYDPATNLPGTPLGCAELEMTQAMECLDYCAPLVPNGCDCFGCCDVTLGDGTMVTVYLGTRDPETDVGTCNLDNAADPVLCNPCTQVGACINTCEECELCIGEVELPPECEEQECPEPLQACGQPGQDPCPKNQACVTGCCVPRPQ